MLQIIKVNNSKQLKQFIDLPHNLYKGDPNYVPELFVSQKALLSKDQCPFFEHSKADYFLALNNNKVVGRIAAIRNNNHNKHANENVGFFGFFECVNDKNISSKLFDKAIEWCKNENLEAVIGPSSFSTNETVGMLFEGYDSPPVVMMTYNPPYYNELAEAYGFTKALDLFAYQLQADEVPQRVLDTAVKIEERLNKQGIIIRKPELKNFDEEIKKIKIVYNSAWGENWGFVPMTDNEFFHLAKELKTIANPDFLFLAEKDGKPIGFSLTIPDMNKILIKIKRGRLFPTGLLKLLYHKNKIDSLRVLTMGVTDNYRKKGIDVCFYAKTIIEARKIGAKTGEASWILENNIMMNRALENINGKVYKKYRMYRLNIT